MPNLTTPPIQSNLPVAGERPLMMASWPKAWGSWFSQIWQVISYGWLWPTKTVTTAYTVQLTDSVILLNGDITVTLPLIANAGPKRITVKVINAGGGTRTVSGNGVNIDGAATVTTTTQYTSWDFVPDETRTFWSAI